jgi:hypothetical protein
MPSPATISPRAPRAVTTALTIVVSQSTGAVQLFQNGEIFLRFAFMQHARAMKWQNSDVEPASFRQDKGG